MRRLLIVSVNGDPLAKLGTLHAGGQCRYILELGRRLIGVGWTIDVFTTRSGDAPVRESVTEGFWIQRFALPKERPYDYDVSAADLADLADDMAAHILREGAPYRLLLACYWLSGIVAERLRRVLPVPVVVSFCSLGYQKEQARGTGECVERIEMEKAVAAAADHIIAATKVEAAILTRVYGVPSEKLTVIPRGVDVDLFDVY